MADSTPPPNSSSETSSSTAEIPPELKPPEIKRSWGDEADDELPIDILSIKERQELDDPEDINIKAETGGTPYTSAKRFEDLNLSEELLKGLYVEMRFERPSKIQAITLPMILTPPYKNLIAQAHNGSGKTTCFVLGMLSRVDPKQQAPQALCICPTRELVIQNLEVLKKMGKYTGISAERAIPENFDNPTHIPVNKRPPITSQVIIGTPGTIKKWLSLRKLSMVYMKILVFDEADHMLAEDGFNYDSMRIMNDIKRSSPKCQVLLFSATFSQRVKDFVTKTIQDYNQLFVKKEDLSLESVKQFKVYCPDDLAKVKVVGDMILELGQKVGQTIIFVRSRNNASMLHKALVDLGYEVTTIQGALSHEDRDKIVQEFKDGLTKVLISTDLLARGFDQSQVNLVVNYDLPIKHDTRSEPDCEVYLHRVGRAGRFGRKGAVFNLISGDTADLVMQKIEKRDNMGPRWKGKGCEAKALAEPMSENVAALQLSLTTSKGTGSISGCRVLFEADTKQSELLNHACFGRVIVASQKDKDKHWYELTLQEAFYLCYTLKCLKIVGDDGVEKSCEELWHFMISKFEMFPEFFKAYSHLRTNNWVVRTGSQYGVDYVAYRHHPALVHSEYAVLVLSERNGISGRLRLWSDLYGTIRLCGGVAKTLLALHVLGISNETDSPLCLKNYQVEARSISRWIPQKTREKKSNAKNVVETQ